jgi:hypothetical protein
VIFILGFWIKIVSAVHRRDFPARWVRRAIGWKTPGRAMGGKFCGSHVYAGLFRRRFWLPILYSGWVAVKPRTHFAVGANFKPDEKLMRRL